MLISVINYRQTLIPGVVFILNIVNFGLFLLFVYFDNVDYIKSNQVVYYLTIFLGVGILLTLIIFPIFLIINFIYNGIQIIKREGFSPKNLLSIILPVLVVMYAVFWNRFGTGFFRSMVSLLYNYLGLAIIYFLLISSAYFFSSAINMIHPRASGIKHIIVLGSGLNKDQVTPLLRGRIEKGIEVYRKNPGSKLIMSGGQGKDELIAEAHAMYRYALERGVPDTDLIIEDESKSTMENLRNSIKIIDQEKPSVAIVSTNYHIFRAVLMANELGVRAKGFGKPTKKYFAINAFIREIIGYIYLKRKFHMLIFSTLSGVYLLLIIVLIILDTVGII